MSEQDSHGEPLLVEPVAEDYDPFGHLSIANPDALVSLVDDCDCSNGHTQSNVGAVNIDQQATQVQVSTPPMEQAEPMQALCQENINEPDAYACNDFTVSLQKQNSSGMGDSNATLVSANPFAYLSSQPMIGRIEKITNRFEDLPAPTQPAVMETNGTDASDNANCNEPSVLSQQPSESAGKRDCKSLLENHVALQVSNDRDAYTLGDTPFTEDIVSLEHKSRERTIQASSPIQELSSNSALIETLREPANNLWLPRYNDPFEALPQESGTYIAQHGDFGDFTHVDTAEISMQKAPTALTECISEHDNGDCFGDIKEKTNTVELQLCVDFGDFAVVDTSDIPTQQKTAAATANVTPDQDVPEDDFEHRQIAAELHLHKGPHQGTIPPEQSVAQHAGFGNFADDNTTNIPTQNASVADEVTQDQDAQGDDFGDFEEQPITVDPQLHNNFGDFATIDSTNIPMQNVSAADEVTLHHATQDDDFGDFGDFEEQPVAVDRQLHNNFSDFATVDSTNMSTKNASVADKVTQDQDAQGDDFGDFGDFDEQSRGAVSQPPIQDDPIMAKSQFVAVHTVGVENDNFDNFRDFEDTPATAESQVRVALLSEDAIVTKARVVFSQLFSSYSTQVKNKNEDLSSPSVVHVNHILGSLISQPKTVDSPSWAIESLEAVLNDVDVLGTAVPKVIMDEAAVSPYEMYSIPPGGVVWLGHLQEKRPVERRLLVPRIAAIQLPSGRAISYQRQTEEPLQVISMPNILNEQPESNFTSTQTGSGSATSPEGRKDGGAGRECHSSVESVITQHFLSQIPDLSFMLASKLSLHKK